MDLFDYMRNNTMKKEAPLASRMRPTSLEEVVGQSHIIGKDKLLYRAIKADKLSSIIFYGPPGTGKTTLAKVIANTTSALFTQINATSAGKKDMEAVVEEAKNNLGMYGKKTILFIDEIHRFNKGQQDYLLPFVEDGTVILIGATTENPYFEVNSALISRSIVFELKPLEKEDIKTLIIRALKDEEKGLGIYRAVIEEDALDFLADMANGDARSALNAIELGVLTTERSEDDLIHITLEVASECIQKRVLKYDKSGDNHYDTISAFIKSMRGSDPDAAIYYLARMLYAGEEVAFIARRIMICAAEDVSNADPNALLVATSAALAVERLGMPEARIVLAQAAAYVACAPKSNSAICAIDDAMNVVAKEKTATIPPYLMDAHYKGAAKLGHGIGYKYAHSYKNHYVKQQYLPDEIKDRVFYIPSDQGYEKKIQEHFKKIKEEAEE
ncbi:MAG: replication-associated recombination protein A [Clostridiales bacterium]|nr:replication-associated recombination protein A [Clostridiales bacterium]